MNFDKFENLPVIPPEWMVNNAGETTAAPTSMTVLQKNLLPYLNEIHLTWWFCFFSVLVFLLWRFIVRPLAAGADQVHSLDHKRFNSALDKNSYNRLFHLDEIKNDLVLQLMGGAILLGFFVTFLRWQMAIATTADSQLWGDQVCWPFFQNCESIMFLRTLPFGYTQMIVYMLLFGGIFLSAYALISKKYKLAHATILVLLISKLYFTIVNYLFSGNFDYYHTSFTLIFLFFGHKRFFLSLCIVLFYFLSTATKIHEGWTLGTYFTSLMTGLPLFGDMFAPLATNGLIFLEMIGAWFLFSHNKVLQRVIFAFFVWFHLYSGILVGYLYPSIVLPPLLILFGPLFKPFDTAPVDRKSIMGWVWCVLLLGAQSISHLIPGDEKMTLEGNFYGLYMFESNHQCITKIEKNGELVLDQFTYSARERCDPYEKWFIARYKFCNYDDADQKYKLQIDHSINGGPFYRIVDEPDLCGLEYKPFSRNKWIKTAEEAEAVGRPIENWYL